MKLVTSDPGGLLSPAEESLRLILDTTPSLIHTGRPDGYLDYFNRRWLEFLGRSLEEVCGWRWTGSVHPEDVASLLQEWHSALATGQTLEAEARVRRADGEYRWLLHRKVPLRDERGSIIKWYGSSLDIEDQKRAHQSILQKERELRQLVDAVPQQIGVLTAEGKPLFANEVALEYHGLAQEEWPEAAEKGSFVHPDDLPRVLDELRIGIASGKLFQFDVRLRSKAGEYRWFLFRANPLQDVAGRILRWYATQTDIEDLKQREETLRRSEAYLAQAQALSRTGSFGWNVLSGDLYWSDETFQILGYERKPRPTLDLLFRRVHPEDVAIVHQAIERASKEQKSLNFEHRLLMPDGSTKYVQVLAQPLKNQLGNLEFVGAVMDVSGSKKAFQEIKSLKEELYKENIVLREEVDKTSMFEEIVGTSPALQIVLARAAKVAPTDSTVLIIGETGTGKELIARAVHKRSGRSTRAFVSVNCAAIPPSLITSELFGHEKGAFTGALQRRPGRFELAEGGTLFLDEIGELPMETQIALLRVLQEREFERVGGTEPIRTDVRVIAATNRDLQRAIAANTFRSDLFYRLNVFPIWLPPLRERTEDVPALVSYFVDRYAKKAGRKIREIRKSTLELLQSYSWPGNVRELQNVIERSLIVCETEEFSIDRSWLSSDMKQTSSPSQAPVEGLFSEERELIEAALAETRGKVAGASGAAARLGLPASTLESKIRSLKINKYRFKEV
jgi:PAS domain S-box-containing protein